MDIQERIEDLKDAEAEFGNQTITLGNSGSYVMIPSATRAVLKMEPGSVNADKLMTMTVRYKDWINGTLTEVFSPDEIPLQGDEVIAKGSTWRILQVDVDSFDVFLRLTLIETNRGAHA